MTTLLFCASKAGDGRPSAAYLFSDSRVTGISGKPLGDDCAKLFVSNECPIAFGFYGGVSKAQNLLSRLCVSIDHKTFDGRTGNTSAILNRLEKYLRGKIEYKITQNEDFGIVICVRNGQRSNPTFHIRLLFHEKHSKLGLIAADHKISEGHFPIEAFGSGGAKFKSSYRWFREKHGAQIRQVFYALRHSLALGLDQLSGGPVQGVCIARIGSAKRIIFKDEQRYSVGGKWFSTNPSKMFVHSDLRDMHFTLIDPAKGERFSRASWYVRRSI